MHWLSPLVIIFCYIYFLFSKLKRILKERTFFNDSEMIEAIAVFQWPNFKIGEGLKKNLRNDASRVLNYGGKYSCKLFTHIHIFSLKKAWQIQLPFLLIIHVIINKNKQQNLKVYIFKIISSLVAFFNGWLKTRKN